jgi:hypothetical protein
MSAREIIEKKINDEKSKLNSLRIECQKQESIIASLQEVLGDVVRDESHN